MDSQYAVHPVAELFPMLAEDELRELAEDIRQRGLLQPIVLDANGSILDGRNRLAACQLAGVEPTFVAYQGDDPAGYALAVNIARRHLTSGARYVIAAKVAQRNGRGGATNIANSTDLYRERIAEAATVLKWCDEAVERAIIAGDMSLSEALKIARESKRKDTEREAKKARLREHAPQYLQLVEDRQIELDGGIAMLEHDEQEARKQLEKERSEEAEAIRKAEQKRRDVTEKVVNTVKPLAELRQSIADSFSSDLALSIHATKISKRLLNEARATLDAIERSLSKED